MSALILAFAMPRHLLALQVAALIPPVGVVVAARGSGALVILVAALAVALGWEWIFSSLRNKPATLNGFVPALIFTVLAPTEVTMFELGVALTLGVVLGELVFGGRGYGFVSAGAVSLAFLMFSFPHLTLAEADGWIALASLPGAVLLVALGFCAWQILVAMAAAVALGLLGLNGSLEGIFAPTLVFGAVFLTCDPFVTAATNPGRWLYGALAGGLVALFAGAGHQEVGAAAIVYATLLSNIFAPLLDQLVIMATVAWRRHRHG